MGNAYLAFDLGASSGRAIIGEIVDGKITLEEVHRFANGPMEKDGSLYWDINSLANEIKTGLKNALATGKTFSGIGVDTWGVDYVMLKADGTFARLPYHYRDSRTDNIPEEVYGLVSQDEIYQKTGIQEMQLNTIFQLYAHKKAHPEDFEGAKLLFMPDALTYILSGAVKCEYSEASTSELLDAKTQNWDFDLIERIGLPKDIFPEIVQPGTSAGTLTEELQAEMGCGSIPVFHIGSHDTASAVASVPALAGEGKWAYISCGTWALLGAELDNPVLTKDAQEACFTNEGGVEGKIRFLTNIMGMWLGQETRRVWKENGKEYSFAEMEDMAKECDGLNFFVDPNNQKFFAPGDMPQNIKDFCAETGQGDIPNDAALMRCIYDSLACCFRMKIELLEKLDGAKLDKLHIVGGGTKDRFLMQLTACCAGIPVISGPVEATATGNIITQAIANGEIADLAAARQLIKESFKIEEFAPKADEKAKWDEAYAKFQKIC